jgi:predicted  nucleic acid-binding Zn-ribbon protein
MENKNPSTGEPAGSKPVNQTGPAPSPVPPKGKLPPPSQLLRDDKDKSKPLLIITVILSVALIASLIIIYIMRKDFQDDLIFANEQKEEVIKNLEQLKVDYGELRVNNDTLNIQLASERKKIDILMDRIKKTEATNKTKMRQYQKEITNLKSLLTGYVHQIDSLNVLTKALREENIKVKSEISQSKRKMEELSQEKESLKSMVEKGGELKTRDITAVALNNREKAASKARQTEQLKICMTLMENTLAKRGPRNVYVRIKSPDGSLLAQSVLNLFTPTAGGPQLIYSAMREVDYNGEELEVCVYYKDQDFMVGAFDIEVFLDGSFVGSTQLILK